MPKHICTCCHLDLYHSMSFRDRCLRAENFLQSVKDKVKLQDSLNMSTVDYNLIESIYKPQREIAKSKAKEHVIDKSMAKNLSQQKAQRRSPRSTSQYASPRQKLLSIKKPRSTAKALSVKDTTVLKVDTDPKVVEHLNSSPQSTVEHCESTTSEELSNLNIGNAVSSFPETELEIILPPSQSKTSPTKKTMKLKCLLKSICSIRMIN